MKSLFQLRFIHYTVDFLFILRCMSFLFFLYPLAMYENLEKSVNQGIALSVYYITQAVTCKHVFMPTVITINRHDVVSCILDYITNFIIVLIDK